MSPIGIAASGLNAAQTRLYASAVNIASDGAGPPVQAVQSEAPGGGVKASLQRAPAPKPFLPNAPLVTDDFAPSLGSDLTSMLVEQASALSAFKANLAVIQTAEDMAKSAFDSIA